MTPAARIQASIELLDEILLSWQSEKRFPADKLIDRYFRARRFMGSKDRAAVGELVYWALRHKASLEWYLNDNSSLTGKKYIIAALVLRGDFNPSLFTGEQYAPEKLRPEEKILAESLVGKDTNDPALPRPARLNYPEWLEPSLQNSLGTDFEAEMHALSDQAPTDLRVNLLKTTRAQLQKNLNDEGFETFPTPLSPLGLRLPKRMPIFTSKYFKLGHFEVQDEGSQLVTLLVDAAPGQKVIDFCAGAGGKTLGIAAMMKNKGRILAWDNSEKRLKQINERLRRAGVDNVQTHVLTSEQDSFIKRHKASADRVLVDAPCSGTGTWRRNPDLKWRFTQKDLDEMQVLQQAILLSAARLVKPGGRLIYATCSLLNEENDMQIENFLKKINDFTVVSAQKIWDKASGDEDLASYLHVTPHQDGVDGFFAAVMERR